MPTLARHRVSCAPCECAEARHSAPISILTSYLLVGNVGKPRRRSGSVGGGRGEIAYRRQSTVAFSHRMKPARFPMGGASPDCPADMMPGLLATRGWSQCTGLARPL